jgi:ribosomal-protein-alanine N-acetyltransferase
MIISAATAADLDAIDEIERLSFPAPWPKETFAGELTREWARIDVGRVDGQIVAFNNYWIVTTELHVLAIATHPDVRGRGYGAQLLDYAIRQAVATGCSLATLEVRRSNVAAIALYERAGFKTVHVRARYYQDDGEDALVMLRGLTPP